MTVPAVAYTLTINPAADRFCSTISYALTINAAGDRLPTISYTLTIDPAGFPTISYALTINDMSFVFSGAPPVCSVSPPFVFHGKPLPAVIPTTVNSPPFPAIPDFNFMPVYNELGDINSAVRRLGDMVQQMGAALSALRVRQQNIEKGDPSTQNQQNKSSKQQQAQKASNFVEVRSARVTSKHKITNPDDEEQFVNITQIDGLLFKNSSGQTLAWHR